MKIDELMQMAPDDLTPGQRRVINACRANLRRAAVRKAAALEALGWKCFSPEEWAATRADAQLAAAQMYEHWLTSGHIDPVIQGSAWAGGDDVTRCGYCDKPLTGGQQAEPCTCCTRCEICHMQLQ